jgi:hypothetical protein
MKEEKKQASKTGDNKKKTRGHLRPERNQCSASSSSLGISDDKRNENAMML